MRRIALAVVVLPLLFAGCASRPKPAGTYAIVVDPRLASDSVRGLPMLHAAVRDALESRLTIAYDAADLDAVIVLGPGRTRHDLTYEILRDDRVVASGTATAPRVRSGSELSIGEQLEVQRRQAAAREQVTASAPREPIVSDRHARWGSDHAASERLIQTSNRIADDIVRKLTKR
jgi:hypothetical protein